MTEGLLVLSSCHGRLSIGHPLVYDLKSGDAIDVWLGRWMPGRVEHGGYLYPTEEGPASAMRGYYFVADDEEGSVIGLYIGMKVRVPHSARTDEWYTDF